MNQIKGNKKINIMLAASLVASVTTPFIAPESISANSINVVDRILPVDSKFSSYKMPNVLSNLIIKEDDVNFTTGDTFRLGLPSGAKWLTREYAPNTTFLGTNGASFTVLQSTDQHVEMKITGTWGEGTDAVEIPLYFEIDGGIGELQLTVDPRSSTLSAGNYTFATVPRKNIVISTAYVADEEGDSNVPVLFAGRNNESLSQLETAEITLKEGTTGGWSRGNVEIELPEWAKIVGFEASNLKGFASKGPDQLLENLEQAISGSSNKVVFSIPSSARNEKREFKLKFYVSSEADRYGDIPANFKWAGIDGGSIILAKVIQPVTVDVEMVHVNAGMKEQAIGDIIITESAKGALQKGKKVEISLTGNAKFSGTPKVEIIDGDSGIHTATVNVDNGVLVFEIDSESTVPSKLKITDLKVDTEHVKSGQDIEVLFSGSALVQNVDVPDGPAFKGSQSIGDKKYSTFDISTSALDVGEFETGYTAKQTIFTILSSEQNRTATEVVFTIGNKVYTNSGVQKTMDVAPFIEANRTYMPIRYVAEAVGIPTNTIIWDEATRTVTIIKDQDTTKLTVGSNVLTVNDVAMEMDVTPKIVAGRTVLPIRAVAEVFQSQVEWKEAEQSIVIK